MSSPSAQRPSQTRKKTPPRAAALQQRRRRLASLRQLQSASPATQSGFPQYILLHGSSAGGAPAVTDPAAAAAHPGDAAMAAAAALPPAIAALGAPGAPAAPGSPAAELPADRSTPAGRTGHAASQSGNAAAAGAAAPAGNSQQGGAPQHKPSGSRSHRQSTTKGGSNAVKVDAISVCAMTGCDCNSLDHGSGALSTMAGKAPSRALLRPPLQCAWRQLPVDFSADIPQLAPPLLVTTNDAAVSRDEADAAGSCSPRPQTHSELGRCEGAGSPRQAPLQQEGKLQQRWQQPDLQPQRGGSGSALAKVKVPGRRDALVSRMLMVTGELQGALEGQLEQLQRSDLRLAEVLRENEVLSPPSFSC